MEKNNDRTTPTTHEEFVRQFGSGRDRPSKDPSLSSDDPDRRAAYEEDLQRSTHKWLMENLRFVDLRHRNLLIQYERRAGQYIKNRLGDWGFDPYKVTPEDMMACARVINVWARLHRRKYPLRSGLHAGEYFVLMLAQSSCLYGSTGWDEAKDILHKCIASERSGIYVCTLCYDVGSTLKLGAGCCGDPSCTDLVNAEIVLCECNPLANDAACASASDSELS